jgi:CheY-like chemotaxis protein
MVSADTHFPAVFIDPIGNITVRISWLKSVDKHNATDEFMLHTNDYVKYHRTGHVRVDIIDSGAGMTADQVQNVFGKCTQFNLRNLQTGQGSGLGLYIAEGIAQQHGGHLTVFSKGLGKGSTFSVELPLFHVPDKDLPPLILEEQQQKYGQENEFGYDDDDDDKEEELDRTADSTVVVETMEQHGLRQRELQKPENAIIIKLIDSSDASSDEQQKKKKRVVEEKEDLPLHTLVVDDTPLNRKLLAKMLQKKGHTCDQAENGQIAVEFVESSLLPRGNNRPYDLILMDYEMPVLNGPDAAQKIRELGCTAVIVGLTGNLLPDDIAYFEDHGANCVLPKPINMQDLEEKCRFYHIRGYNDYATKTSGTSSSSSSSSPIKSSPCIALSSSTCNESAFSRLRAKKNHSKNEIIVPNMNHPPAA